MPNPREQAGGSNEATVVGESVMVSGRLMGEEELSVKGRVNGELELTKTLVVESSGIIKAEVSVKDAVINGAVVGNVTASERVELTQGGRMVGDIRAPRVVLVEGASFKGRIQMGEGGPRAERTARPDAKTSPSKVVPTARVERKAEPTLAKSEKPLPPSPPAPAKKKVLVRKR